MKVIPVLKVNNAKHGKRALMSYVNSKFQISIRAVWSVHSLTYTCTTISIDSVCIVCKLYKGPFPALFIKYSTHEPKHEKMYPMKYAQQRLRSAFASLQSLRIKGFVSVQLALRLHCVLQIGKIQAFFGAEKTYYCSDVQALDVCWRDMSQWTSNICYRRF